MDFSNPMALMLISSFSKSDKYVNYIPFMCVLFGIIIPMIPFHNIRDKLRDIIDNIFIKDEVAIFINSHKSETMRWTAKITDYTFSSDGLAIIHYMSSRNLEGVYTYTEILNLERDYDNDKANKKYSLFPLNNKDITIITENGDKIFCQCIHNSTSNSDDDNEKSKDKDKKPVPDKNYQIKLSVPSNKKDKKLCAKNLLMLKNFINDCVVEYKNYIKKRTDSSLYIYDYKGSSKSSDDNYDRYTPNFAEHIMEHNKDLNVNIFFYGKNDLINYIKPFIYDELEKTNPGEEKYKISGYTFKAGLLFWGSPGCGKTSTIKAIAKYTNRHIINIKLDKVKTCSELEAIFYLNKIHERDIKRKQICYVIEDCDAFNNKVLKSRKLEDDEKSESSSTTDLSNSINSIIEKATISTIKKLSDDADELNLSCFLNILDGIIELHGVMIILTTNYPDRIDDALTRPGRIDFRHEFKRASVDIIKDMLKFKFGVSEETINSYSQIKHLKDYVLSPAEIQNICFRSSDINDCLNKLISLMQKS